MKKLALIPFAVGCAAEPDFSKYTAFSKDAVCTEDPVSDFVLAEGSPLSNAIKASPEEVGSVTYYGIADRQDLRIYNDVVRTEIRGLELAFYEGGNLMVAYRDDNGSQIAGMRNDGDVKGFACDDGTVVAQYLTKNLLVVGKCSFDLDPETLDPEKSCRGSVYYQCPYSPDASLNSYDEDCRKLVDFSTNNTPVFCTILDEDGSSIWGYCSDFL